MARDTATNEQLQANIDFACSHGVDCSLIQPGGSCYNPNTLIDHASYVMNAYYHSHGRIEEACSFNHSSWFVFKDPRIVAKVVDRTKTMDDVYGAFYDFSCMIEKKVDKNDPNAMKTLKQLGTIKKLCRENGDLQNRKSYVNDESKSKALLIAMLVLLLAILLFAYLKHQLV
ncbi:unnamed protein product [Microthlaspi erraticum]|uniref:X8 domain-containing protein n=1 Tax=Microthlaspi erraticum TaxID=1685480 RepID=A0A6D2JTY8_9BRAS|nr:unnamed protein product [Microthlaspi erraticum]